MKNAAQTIVSAFQRLRIELGHRSSSYGENGRGVAETLGMETRGILENSLAYRLADIRGAGALLRSRLARPVRAVSAGSAFDR